MRVVKVAVALALAVVLGVAAAQAAPVNLKQVPADAKWLAHVDVDAIRASTVVQKMWHQCMETHKDAAEHFDKVRAVVGMDPRKDLHGLTCYGKQPGQHKGVLIVDVKIDTQSLLQKAAMALDHKTTKHGAYELHSWTAKGPHHTHTVAGTIYKPECLVFASSVEELKAALDVLDGKAASLSSDSPLAGRLRPGTTFLFRATGLAAAKLPCKCPLGQQIDSVRISMGENDGKSFFRAKVAMTNTEVVGQVKAIVEGAKAMAALHCSNDAQAKKLVDALQVKTDDKTLSVRWNAPANDVWEVIQKHAKRWAEMHAKHWADKHAKKGCEKKPAAAAAPACKSPATGKASEQKPKGK